VVGRLFLLSPRSLSRLGLSLFAKKGKVEKISPFFGVGHAYKLCGLINIPVDYT